MGIAAAAGVESGILPPVGDQANKVVQSTFAAVGPGLPIAVRGPVNVEIWASYLSTLTTTANSLTASLAAIGVAAIGNSINSVNLPAGSTIKTLPGGNGITVGLPTQTWYGSCLTAQAAITGLVDTNLSLAKLVGASIISPYFTAGTTVTAVGAVAGTVQTSAPPTSQPANPQPLVPFGFALSTAAITTTGTDTAATYTGWEIVWAATVQLERSFDGGRTWLVANIGTLGAATRASWAGTNATTGTPLSFSFGESEKQVMYRLNCLTAALAAGTTLNYRLSQTAVASESLALASVI